MSRDEAVRAVVEALYDAADDDSATGGPDLVRRIYPIVDAGHRRGHRPAARRPRSARSPRRSSPTAQRPTARQPSGRPEPMTMPFYASPEQLMRDRSEYARKGIARGRSVVVLTYADGVLFVAENPSTTLHKVGEIYDRIGVRRGRPLQRVREPAGRRRSGSPTSAATPTTGATSPAGRSPTRTRRRSTRSSPSSRSRTRWSSCVAEVGDSAGGRPALPADLRRLDRATSRTSWCIGGQAEPIVGHLQGALPRRAGRSTPGGRGPRAVAALAAVGAEDGKARAADGRPARGRGARPDAGRSGRFRRVVGAALRTLLGDEATPDAARRTPAAGPAPTPPSVRRAGHPARPAATRPNRRHRRAGRRRAATDGEDPPAS